MSMTLYVGNLSYQTSNADLERLFTQAGTVESVQVVTTIAGNSRGFGFVEMSSRAEGEAAIALFDSREISGRSLTVYEEQPPKACAAGMSFGSDAQRKARSYAASRAVRWPRP